MRYGILLAALALGACTLQQKDGRTVSEFHPPLVYPKWTTERYTDENGKPVCAVSAGPRGVSVFLRTTMGGGLGVSVQGNRKLHPGSSFSINVNGHHYETLEPFFEAEDAERLVEDFLAADRAYLEWSEIRAADRSRLRTSNILLLDEFRAPFNECQRLVSGR